MKVKGIKTLQRMLRNGATNEEIYKYFIKPKIASAMKLKSVRNFLILMENWESEFVINEEWVRNRIETVYFYKDAQQWLKQVVLDWAKTTIGSLGFFAKRAGANLYTYYEKESGIGPVMSIKLGRILGRQPSFYYSLYIFEDVIPKLKEDL